MPYAYSANDHLGLVTVLWVPTTEGLHVTEVSHWKSSVLSNCAYAALVRVQDVSGLAWRMVGQVDSPNFAEGLVAALKAGKINTVEGWA